MRRRHSTVIIFYNKYYFKSYQKHYSVQRLNNPYELVKLGKKFTQFYKVWENENPTSIFFKNLDIYFFGKMIV